MAAKHRRGFGWTRMYGTPGGYCVIRLFRDSYKRRVIMHNVSLEMAQSHCNSPETSSSTCKSAKCKAYTRRHGPWFDGFDQEPCKGRRG